MGKEADLESLAPEIRGILLVLQATVDRDAALAALAGHLGEAARQAWLALQALDEAARTRMVDVWRGETTCVLPAGLARLHPSWATEALAGEPSDIVAAVRGDVAPGRPVPPETARELARLAFARLAPLWESDAGPLAEELLALAPEELLVEIKRRGARTVGRSLAGAASTLRARAMASAGEPWAGEMASAATAEVTTEQRAAARALARAGAVVEGRTAEERLLAVGLAATKAELAREGWGSLARLAGRLPAALGRALIGW